jgi:multidrug resistance efflux pump
MKKNLISLLQNPKIVIIVSLIIAIAIGTFGYIKINQGTSKLYNQADSQATTTKDDNISQNQNLTLGFLSGGRIKSVLVKSGDIVKKGEILATLDAGNVSGALTQAKASYATAEANYQKVVNGATSADITVSNASLEISQATLTHSKETLVLTLNNSLTSAINAVNNNTNAIFDNPNSDNLELINTGITFSNQQLENNIINERILINGMFPQWKQELVGIAADSDLSTMTNHALAHLQTIATYLDDLNSLFTLYASATTNNSKTTMSLYQGNILSARASITSQIALLTGALQAVSSAEENVAQSQALLNQKTSTARPEDIAIAAAQVNNANGAVQIAEAAYQNTIITAPSDGIIASVSITPGQIAIPNVPAIELSVKN